MYITKYIKYINNSNRSSTGAQWLTVVGFGRACMHVHAERECIEPRVECKHVPLGFVPEQKNFYWFVMLLVIICIRSIGAQVWPPKGATRTARAGPRTWSIVAKLVGGVFRYVDDVIIYSTTTWLAERIDDLEMTRRSQQNWFWRNAAMTAWDVSELDLRLFHRNFYTLWFVVRKYKLTEIYK